MQVREIEAGTHTLLICNLAPPDMVGHTGFMDKAMEAASHTDMCVGEISAAPPQPPDCLLIAS